MEASKSLKELTKNRIKIAYRYPRSQPYTIDFISTKKDTGVTEMLFEDGTFSDQPLQARTKKIARMVLADFEPCPGYPGMMRPFGYLEYIIESDQSFIENQEVRLAENILLKKHQYLLTHSHAAVIDKKGNNLNKNMISFLFEVIDETNNIRAEKETNELITKCMDTLSYLMNNDEKSFMDMAYALNIPNIHTVTSKEVLYNKMSFIIKHNPIKFDEVYNSAQKSLLAMITRALYLPLQNGETALQVKEGYYQFDNLAICKVIHNNEDKINEELLHYFNTNPGSLNKLEKRMGVFLDRNEVKPLPPVVQVGDLDKGGNKDLRAEVKEKSTREKQIKQIIFHKVDDHKKAKETNESAENFIREIDQMKSDPLYKDLSEYIDQCINFWCKSNKVKNPFAQPVK